VSLDFPFAFNAIKLIAMMARLGGFMFAFPVLNTESFPVKHRIFFLLVVSVLLMPATPPEWGAALAQTQLDMFGLALMMCVEVLLGLTVALIVTLFFDVFELVGYQFGDLMGFTMAEVIDPSSGQTNNVVTILLVQMFIIIFLVCDFHHDFLRLAAMSFSTVGPGAFVLNPEMGGSIISLVVEVYRMGFQLALPVFALNMLLNICLALISKVGEEFPVLLLSFPIKIGVGLLLIMGMLPICIYYSRLVGEMMVEWIRMLIV